MLWSMFASVATKFWKQISLGLVAVIAMARYGFLKRENRKLKSHVKKRIIIDRIESEHQFIEEEEKQAKEKLRKAKSVEDLNKEWNNE